MSITENPNNSNNPEEGTTMSNQDTTSKDGKIMSAITAHINGDKPLTDVQLEFIRRDEIKTRIRLYMAANGSSLGFIAAVEALIQGVEITNNHKKENTMANWPRYSKDNPSEKAKEWIRRNWPHFNWELIETGPNGEKRFWNRPPITDQDIALMRAKSLVNAIVLGQDSEILFNAAIHAQIQEHMEAMPLPQMSKGRLREYFNNMSKEDTDMTQQEFNILVSTADAEDPIGYHVQSRTLVYKRDAHDNIVATGDETWVTEMSFDTLIAARNYHHLLSAGASGGAFRIVYNDKEVSIIPTTTSQIWEFRRKLNGEKGFTVITTTVPTAVELEGLNAFAKSLKETDDGSKAQHAAEKATRGWYEAHGEKDKFLTIVPGFSSTTDLYLPMQQVLDQGGNFRIERYPQRIMKSWTAAQLRTKATNCSMSFVPNGDDLTVYKVYDRGGKPVLWNDFESYLGIVIRNGEKLGKRSTELSKASKFGRIYNDEDDMGGVTIHAVLYDEIYLKALDGMQGISESFFLKLIENIPDHNAYKRALTSFEKGEIIRGTFRHLVRGNEVIRHGHGHSEDEVLFNEIMEAAGFGDLFDEELDIETLTGLFKGDAIIVPNHILKAKFGYIPDIVQPMVRNSNTGVYEFVNCKRELSTDGSRGIVTYTPHHAHHAAYTNDQLLSIFQTGADNWMFPKAAVKGSLDALLNIEYDRLANGQFPKSMMAPIFAGSTRDKLNPERLQASVFSLCMKWEGARRRHSEAPLRELPQAIKLAGRGITERMKSAYENKHKIWSPITHSAYMYVTSVLAVEMLGFDPEADGKDIDKCFFFKQAHSWVKPTDVFIRDYERHGGEDHDDSEIVMIRSVEFPDGTVKVMAISVRMPTSWGEWSMNEVDLSDFPMYHDWDKDEDGNNVYQTLVYADRPEFIEEMKATQTIAGLPSSGKPVPLTYTQAWAEYQAQMAVANPGIGSLVNALIAQFALRNTYFRIMVDNLENCVDCMNSKPDMAAFIAIRQEREDRMQEILENVTEIDEHIYKYRMQGVKLKGVKTTKDGYFSELMAYTLKARQTWVQRVNELVANAPVIPELMGVDMERTVTYVNNDNVAVTMRPADIAVEWIKEFRSERNNRYRGWEGVDSESLRRWQSRMCQRWVSKLDRQLSDEVRDLIIIAVYQDIMSIGEGKESGFIFQTPLTPTDRSPMTFLLDAMFRMGVADHINWETGLVTMNEVKEEEINDWA